MLASADGNVSFRLNEKEILITPSGVSKARVRPEEMSLVSIDGEVLKGKPSSEKLMHLTIYKNCPEAKAVVHAHPPHAVAWSIARPELEFLPSEAMSELILATGGVPFVPYARPSTQDMGDQLLPFLNYRAMILSRHGALTWGESLEEAYRGMERIEHAAQILFLSEQLGGVTSLPKEEVDRLYEMRKKIGKVIL